MTDPLWSSTQAADATGGTTGTWSATGVSIDTRNLVPGDLFVALTDVRDGHDFVVDALAKGAAAALVSRIPENMDATDRLLVVPDVLQGLDALARAARTRTNARVIAVTGSVGKTSTKEMLRTALASQGSVHAAEKSFNNHWGVPLTLARMPAATDYAVIEIGMNAPGEISPLSQLARPHVAIITNVEEVHMAAFSNIRGIAHEKAAIFDGLEPDGTAILNRDNRMYPVLARRARKSTSNLIRYGMAGRPEFALKRVSVGAEHTALTFRHDGNTYHAKIGAPGKHFAGNALAVLAATDAVGADMARAAIALAHWCPPAGRGTRTRVVISDLDGHILLIDESYNANPTSMAAALDALAETDVIHGTGRISKGRRIAIIGDMLELGDDEIARHKDIAGLGAMDAIDVVHTVGPLSETIHKLLPGQKRGRHFATGTQAAAVIRRLLDPGDVVMVKASLGIALGEVVDAIKKLGQGNSQQQDGA